MLIQIIIIITTTKSIICVLSSRCYTIWAVSVVGRLHCQGFDEHRAFAV
uniref:Uncharacterized protein n=1 Tax=Anguilla anguilla TaxID=7936 RepID=A0A0E9UL44_ANGAN